MLADRSEGRVKFLTPCSTITCSQQPPKHSVLRYSSYGCTHPNPRYRPTELGFQLRTEVIELRLHRPYLGPHILSAVLVPVGCLAKGKEAVFSSWTTNSLGPFRSRGMPCRGGRFTHQWRREMMSTSCRYVQYGPFSRLNAPVPRGHRLKRTYCRPPLLMHIVTVRHHVTWRGSLAAIDNTIRRESLISNV
jgi:hypothetical protein